MSTIAKSIPDIYKFYPADILIDKLKERRASKTGNELLVMDISNLLHSCIINTDVAARGRKRAQYQKSKFDILSNFIMSNLDFLYKLPAGGSSQNVFYNMCRNLAYILYGHNQLDELNELISNPVLYKEFLLNALMDPPFWKGLGKHECEGSLPPLIDYIVIRNNYKLKYELLNVNFWEHAQVNCAKGVRFHLKRLKLLL